MRAEGRKILRVAVAVALLFTLAACNRTAAGRDATAAEVARAAGLDSAVARGAAFDLQLYRRDDPQRPGPLFVYIEGDGAAYLDPRTPAADPTPVDPLGLRLAAADPGPAVVYVGRPCQFAPGRSDARCAVPDWTTGRFSESVVAAVDGAIGRARAQSPQRPLVLVGYSGGGVVAALVAVRRRDVALLITVAAPLDPADWTRRLGLAPLAGSGSPLDRIPALAAVRQVAFAGGRDATVPVETIRAAIDRLGPQAQAGLIVMADFDHRCCWVQAWPRLRAQAWEAVP